MKPPLPVLLLLLLPAAARPQGAPMVSLRDTVARTRDQAERRRLLERSMREHPSDAWAHYAFALASAGEDAAGPPTFRKQPGDQTLLHLKQALAADSSFAPAAIALAELALCGNDAARLEAARTALRRAGAPALSAAAATALARLDLRLGDFAAAAEDAQPAVADSLEGAAALRVLGIALVRLNGPGNDGARAYLEGMARGTAAAAYYRDASGLASPEEREEWRRAPTDSARGAWILGFWSRRAIAAGVPTADRLAEHFHRLAVADRDYRAGWAPSPRLPPATGAIDADVPYDDRGLVYLRYGAPDEVERRGDTYVWTYWRTRVAPLRFFFSGTRFLDVIPLGVRPGGAMRELSIAPVTPYDRAVDVLQELSPGDPELAHLQARLTLARQALQVPSRPRECRRRQCAPEVPDAPDSGAVSAVDLRSYQAELGAIMRRRVAAALAAEDARPTVDRALPFFYDLATFRGASGMTDVIASLAVPGDLVPGFQYPDGRILYAPRVQVAIASPGAARVAFADSAFQRFASRRLQPGEFLRLIIPLVAEPAPLATHRVGVTVLTDSVVGQVYGGIRAVPDYSGDQLMISDIVLAEADQPGGWRRGAIRLAFMPAQHFPARGAVKLFYEIYNLPAGSAYRTAIAIERERNGAWERVQGLFADAPGLRLDFEDHAPAAGGAVQEVRVIHPNLRPGRYRIVVAVASPDRGQEAVRERRFELLK